MNRPSLSWVLIACSGLVSLASSVWLIACSNGPDTAPSSPIPVTAAPGAPRGATVRSGSFHAQSDIVKTGEVIDREHPLISLNDAYAFSPEGDAWTVRNSDTHDVYAGARTVVSQANLGGFWAPQSYGEMQGNGDFEIFANNLQGITPAVWTALQKKPDAPPPPTAFGACLRLQNDGNLVIYAKDNTPLWDLYDNCEEGGTNCKPRAKIYDRQGHLVNQPQPITFAGAACDPRLAQCATGFSCSPGGVCLPTASSGNGCGPL